MKNIIIAALVVGLSGCALPETTVRTGASRPMLAVKNAPTDAVLFVDGLQIGPASQFNGAPNVLVVEEGVHQVEIRRSSSVLHTEKVFVSSGETRTVTVSPGGR